MSAFDAQPADGLVMLALRIGDEDRREQAIQTPQGFCGTQKAEG